MNTKILFRQDYTTLEEMTTSKDYFDVTESRINLKDSIVIGRYSVLPFYQELERDLALQNSRLINTYKQHKYIADFEYYEDLKDLTPQTFFDLSEAKNYEGPFVVKGKTNSRKFDWNTLMFAPSKTRASEIAYNLRKDYLLDKQEIIFREYIKLNTLEIGLNGLPFSNEWRFFCFQEEILSFGFYWSISEVQGIFKPGMIGLVKEVCSRIKNKVNFFVVDVAEKEDGSFIIIELNDGQQSGLSENDADVLYLNLNKVLRRPDVRIY